MKSCLLFLSTLTLLSCNSKVAEFSYNINTNEEIAQQIGESMAAIDESGGSTAGAYAMTKSVGYDRAIIRITKNLPVHTTPFLNLALSSAVAGNCTTYAFSDCNTSTYQKSRNLTGCLTAVAGGSIAGSVILTYAGTGAATCTIPASNDTVTRVANIGINGLRGAVFGMQPTSTGQTLTRTGATSYTYSDTGTTRKFTDPNKNSLLNLTSSTSSTINISGSTRDTRTITGGAISIVNNLNSVSCNFSPTGVTWTATCNCPTSGSWTATCSDTSTLTLTFTSTCGQATLTQGSSSSTITLDRCE